ncbi:MAG: radical SAM protein [Candidatus Riflebacteria bacterium]|nr:radical SAM protein [Candidatus Riflebacteria bacterium]
MVVLLINPSHPDIFPPPSLGYLKAFIEARDSSTKVVLADVEKPSSLPKLSSVTVVGISVHSFAVPAVAQLIPALRKEYPTARLVAGGHHASALPDQMLSIGFDQVVTGPGEIALLDIINGLHVPIIIGSLPESLDDFPFPDYSGLHGTWTLPLGHGGRALPIITSRGCPFACKFCASAEFWHRCWHPRSPDNVLKEIRWRFETNQIDSFMFEDDNFTLDRTRALAITDGLTKLRQKFPGLRWQAASRAETLADAELCTSMSRAGATHVWLGIETGSPEILKNCGKATTIERMLKGIETAEKCGLRTVGQFIIGLIGESRVTIEETRNFIQKSRLSHVGVNKAWVLPRTYLYDAACHAGFSPDDYLIGIPFFTWEHSNRRLDYWSDIVQTAGPGFSGQIGYNSLRFMFRRCRNWLGRLYGHFPGRYHSLQKSLGRTG